MLYIYSSRRINVNFFTGSMTTSNPGTSIPLQQQLRCPDIAQVLDAGSGDFYKTLSNAQEIFSATVHSSTTNIFSWLQLYGCIKHFKNIVKCDNLEACNPLSNDDGPALALVTKSIESWLAAANESNLQLNKRMRLRMSSF
jgi:hypothetical protein